MLLHAQVPGVSNSGYSTDVQKIPIWISPTEWHLVDNFGTVVGENPTPYGILALWAVNGLSIVYWVSKSVSTRPMIIKHKDIFPNIFSTLGP